MGQFDRQEFERGMIEALGIDGGEVCWEGVEGFLSAHFESQRRRWLLEAVAEDLRFFRSLDPASTLYSESQILSVRRGMSAIAAHRIFGEVLKVQPERLYDLEVIAKYVQKDTNVEIHPAASIGVPFAIDHGHGTVIGATTRIGRRVFIYHGVTLGASGRRSRVQRRHPIIDDEVFFGNGSQVLGPSILGKGVRMAANVTMRDCLIGERASIAMGATLFGVNVPPGCKVFGFDPEDPKRYWVMREGEERPSWVRLDAFNPEDFD